MFWAGMLFRGMGTDGNRNIGVGEFVAFFRPAPEPLMPGDAGVLKAAKRAEKWARDELWRAVDRQGKDHLLKLLSVNDIRLLTC